MLYIIFFPLLFPLSVGEWELPEELRPPKDLIQRVGGFSPFVGYGDIPEGSLLFAVRAFLSESIETKYSSLVLSDSDKIVSRTSCLLSLSSRENCFQSNGNKLSVIKPAKECSEFNSTFLTLYLPDENGDCRPSEFKLSVGTNIIIFCRPPCFNKSQQHPDPFGDYLQNQIIAEETCICDNCASVVSETRATNVTDIISDAMEIDIIDDSSGITQIKASFHHILATKCLSFVSTKVQFRKADNKINMPRFTTQRGRFYCPSEVTCPWQIFYVFNQDDPTFRPAYLFAVKVILLGIHIALGDRAIFYYLNKIF